jgi:hypothetical protein
MDIITRQEAKAQGLTHYFTGLACKQGHVAQRFVSTCHCCICHLERKQRPEVRTQAAARQQTPKVKAHKAKQGAASYAANREKIAASYAANREKIAVMKAVYRKQNIEKIAAQKAARYQTNRVELAARQTAYAKANRHIYNAIAAKRRAAKLQATPSWADTAAIKAIYEQALFMSKVLGEKQHVDHIYPLISDEVCGLHVAANLQILSATDNIKKSNKLLPMYEMPVQYV